MAKLEIMLRCRILFFLIAYLGLSGCVVFAQIEPTFRFTRYGIEDGLSQVTALCLMEDDAGYVWIGTQDGLNRFDGYSFKIFKHNPDDNSSISGNWINTIFQDDDGEIWIGTTAGLNQFDLRTESFIRFGYDDTNPKSLTDRNVTAIVKDDSGRLWTGTDNGLNAYDIKSQSFKHYHHDSLDDRSISSNRILSGLVDNQGKLWIGTDQGLNLYNPTDDSFNAFRNDSNDATSISGDEVITMFQDNEDRLWVGTTSGLNLFVKETKTFKRYLGNGKDPTSKSSDDIRAIGQDHKNRIWVGTRWNGIKIIDSNLNNVSSIDYQVDNPNSLSNNTVLSIIQDSRDNMWVGVSRMGFNIWNSRTEKFRHYRRIYNNENSLLNNGVRGILKDHKDQLWVATFEGISVITENGKIRHFKHDPNDPASLSSNQISCIYQDRQQRIWIGTVYGLNLYHPETDSFTRFLRDELTSSSLSNDHVYCVFQDNQDRLWVGTDLGGLNELNIETGKFHRYAFDGQSTRSTSHFRIKCIIQDSLDQIWIGTDLGVNLFNPRSRSFKYYQHEVGNPRSLSNNTIRSLALDRAGRVFIGTEGGVNLFDPNTKTFRHWRVNDGLSNDVVYSILFDDRNTMWISTNKGINKVNIESDEITLYDRQDGLQSDEFNSAAGFKDSNGFMYFGGVNGLSYFHPDSLRKDIFIPKVVITEFSLFNKYVSISDSSILQQSPNYADRLTLNYDEDIFAFEFAALHFEQPNKIEYAFKLEPFHNDWIYTDATDRKAGFTKIPAGDYTFQVKASSITGLWSDASTKLKVTIVPPWYQTVWAKGLFVFLILTAIGIIIRARERNAKQVMRQLEAMVEDKTKLLLIEKEEVSKQLAEKQILMQEVHHRVKNNLTFLKSLLYLRGNASNDKEVRRILDECQARIQSVALVHQNLYDVEDATKVNFKVFLDELSIELFGLFEGNLSNIEFLMKVEDIKIDMKTSVFLGLIINELITNSFKYAFNNGVDGLIEVELIELKDTYELNYADNGKGFPEDFEFSTSSGFGFRLINILLKQLNAQMYQQRTFFNIVIAK